MYNYFYAKKSTFRRNIMKERYNIEISDIQLSVVSDEPEDFVNSIVEKINERVNDLIVRNKRCSKLDAALLCALDYCGECTKAEKRIRNLEAQISLYDANLKRMREDLAASQKASPAVKSALGIKDSADDDTEDKAQSAVTDTEDNAQSDETCTSCASCSADAECAPEDETKKAEEAKPAKENRAESKRDKLEQIEMLLRRNDDK